MKKALILLSLIISSYLADNANRILQCNHDDPCDTLYEHKKKNGQLPPNY